MWSRVKHMCGIPPVAVMETYPNSPDLGGLRAEFPIVTMQQQYGLFHEVVTDYYQNVVVADNWPSYNGNVWTIQLTARPGYYLTPDQIENYGLGQNLGGPEWGE